MKWYGKKSNEPMVKRRLGNNCLIVAPTATDRKSNELNFCSYILWKQFVLSCMTYSARSYHWMFIPVPCSYYILIKVIISFQYQNLLCYHVQHVHNEWLQLITVIRVFEEPLLLFFTLFSQSGRKQNNLCLCCKVLVK